MIWIYLFYFSCSDGREAGTEKLIGILDLRGISYKNVDPRGLITAFQFLQVTFAVFFGVITSTLILLEHAATYRINVTVNRFYIVWFVQSYYPECLAKAFVINMPPFFAAIWRMVAHFLDKATLEKVYLPGDEIHTKKRRINKYLEGVDDLIKA